MNIALIVHDLDEHGGHSLYTKVLANELSANHEVAVFSNRCDRPNNARWRSHHVRAWRSTALATVNTFPLGLRSHEAALAGYDIRHTQGYCGGKPNVVTAHICVSAYLESLRDISRRTRASLTLMAAIESRFYQHYDGPIIAVSEKTANDLQEHYVINGQITVIPHGVEASRFNGDNRARYRDDMRRRLQVNDNEILALYVGDLTKAHSYLKHLSSATPHIKFGIVTSSARYRWSAPNVQILPPTSELQKYYAAADAFVFPTTYDSFGMVVLEAMATGLAVFTSDQAGAAELIESGKDGFVLPLNDWVEATAENLGNETLLGAVGRAAAEKAKRFDWPSVVAAIEKVYEQTLGQPSHFSSGQIETIEVPAYH